jgi:hypothetical protein
MSDKAKHSLARALGLWAFVSVLSYFFANVEIQIEGPNGWASALPVTFRIEHHWLLDLFWGGRPMTGYHAWVFSFMFLMLHTPLAFLGRWTPRLEARVLATICWFWILEDALWFVLNPAFGWSKLDPAHAVWHKQWFLGVPTDYWTFTLAGAALYAWSWTGSDDS